MKEFKYGFIGIFLTVLLLVGTYAATRVPNDYLGEGVSDYYIYSPENGTWLFQGPNLETNQQFGYTNAIPISGYYDNDNLTDYGVFVPSNGTWHIELSETNRTSTNITFGASGVYPIAADLDNNGIYDTAYYNPYGYWYIRFDDGSMTTIQFGVWGYYPVVGDFDGDGATDLATYFPEDGFWYFDLASNGFGGIVYYDNFGMSNSLALADDYDGDGVTDYGCYTPDNGKWYVKLSSSTDAVFSTMYGYPGTVPFTGHFDNDDAIDFGCYHFAGYLYTYSSVSGHSVKATTMFAELPLTANQFNYSYYNTADIEYYNNYISQNTDTNSSGGETNSHIITTNEIPQNQNYYDGPPAPPS